jgi:hypothetical protein
MNYFVTVPDDGCLLESFGAFMREPGNRPTLDDILGAACEIYRIDPDEIKERKAVLAVRAYCYLATRWSREPFALIGAHIGIGHDLVNRFSRSVMILRRQDMILRDDIDLLAIRIAERVLIRNRLHRCPNII